MRYLTIAAEYSGSCIRDDFKGPVEPEELLLPEPLCSALRAWNDEYKGIIPMDMDQRAAPEAAARIDRLDKVGRELAARVREALGEAKVRYYSEGHLKYLD